MNRDDSLFVIKANLDNPQMWFLLPFSLALRLLLEGKRKIFGILYLSAIFGMFLVGMGNDMVEDFNYYLLSMTWLPGSATLFGLLFGTLIYYSFVERRSYVK